ncbi:SCO family protein [Pseudaminobacter soli (ex Li et al. 2025)]|uniref:SCO family protein n=1 Tax=Pseudaminobacter soli (ex Li et al. 2025) TaxID=1295366 RepID=A0A2P7SE94_9HYPH|nr:SCO family protein [Mesorhizobium soli]PSJ60836.1 SCO family protein [Mesorhizobium soli]
MAAKSGRAALVAIAAGAVLLGAGTVYLLSPNSPLREQQSAVVEIGGPFKLTTQDGKPLSNEDLKGSPFAVFFGFTHCPEVCPTTLWEMSEALKALGDKADKLKVLFVSVDPERDTPEFMSRYLKSFDPRIIGLTGSQEAIDAVGKAYRVYSKKVPTDGGDYTMDHTASVYLMDAEGRFSGVISYEEDSKVRLAKLERLVNG